MANQTNSFPGAAGVSGTPVDPVSPGGVLVELASETTGTLQGTKQGTMAGATDVADGEKGAVPKPVAGEDDEYLRGDGTFQPVVEQALADAKGDIVVATGADAFTRLPVGAHDGQIVIVDSLAAEGIRWDIRHNIVATTDPAAANDNTQGYAPGSIWVNVATDEAFICLDATTSAAVWKQTSNDATIQAIQKETPKEHFLGSALDYPNAGGPTASEIQYSRVWLTAGLSFDMTRYFQEGGGSGTRNFNIGVYDQTDPLDDALDPDSKLVETGTTATDALDNGLFVDTAISQLDITVTGYYWIALIVDSASISFAVSDSMRAGYAPVRRESSSGTTLPASAGTLSNPTSAIVRVAIVEV